MLRHLFNQPKRDDEGLLLQANQAIDKFNQQLRKLETDGKLKEAFYRLDLMASGFQNGLNELEQSMYCATQYSAQVLQPNLSDSEAVQMTEYKLHVYFYKNAIIRVFSVLDKLGYFLDELLELNTASIKERFSYYTVLRRLNQLGVHSDLNKQLQHIKTNHQTMMRHLKMKRNLEIHHINAEILDDIKLISDTLNDHQQLENIQQNLENLGQGYNMACSSVHTVFEYTNQSIRQRVIRIR